MDIKRDALFLKAISGNVDLIAFPVKIRAGYGIWKDCISVIICMAQNFDSLVRWTDGMTASVCCSDWQR